MPKKPKFQKAMPRRLQLIRCASCYLPDQAKDRASSAWPPAGTPGPKDDDTMEPAGEAETTGNRQTLSAGGRGSCSAPFATAATL